MKHNTLVEHTLSQNNKKKKFIHYSLLFLLLISVITIIAVIIVFSLKSSDFMSSIDFNNSSFSIVNPIVNSNEYYYLRISFKDKLGQLIKDGPNDITLNIQYKSDDNLNSTKSSEIFNYVNNGNYTLYEAKLLRSIATKYNLKAYYKDYLIGTSQNLTIIPSKPFYLNSEIKKIKDIGKQNIKFTISDINRNDIILRNSLIQNKIENKTKWDLSCLSSNLKSNCSIGDNIKDNIFSCDVEFNPKTVNDIPVFNCSLSNDNQKFYLLDNNNITFSHYIQNILISYDTDYKKINVDAIGGNEFKYSIPSSEFNISLKNDEYECASMKTNLAKYISINSETNKYEIKNPNNILCSYYWITAESENMSILDIIPAYTDKGIINAEQRALNVLGNELGINESLHNLEIARKYTLNFFDYYFEPASNNIYGALYLSVKRILKLDNSNPFLLHLNYTELELIGKFTIMDSRFETSMIENSTPMKLYKVDFLSSRLGKDTFYFTLLYKVVLSAEKVFDRNGKEYIFLSKIDKMFNITKEAAYIKSEEYFKKSIIVSKEHLKLRTLLKLSYNKLMNSPDFEKIVRDKSKTFYESNGNDIINYLNYVIVNTWDRVDSTMIFSNILTYEEGNLEGDMKLIFPYSEVEDIKSLSEVLKVTSNFVNYNSDISKNEIVIVDLFFRKQGLNPVYFDLPIKYLKSGSKDIIEVSYQTKLKEIYPLVIQALKEILEKIK